MRNTILAFCTASILAAGAATAQVATPAGAPAPVTPMTTPMTTPSTTSPIESPSGRPTTQPTDISDPVNKATRPAWTNDADRNLNTGLPSTDATRNDVSEQNPMRDPAPDPLMNPPGRSTNVNSNTNGAIDSTRSTNDVTLPRTSTPNSTIPGTNTAAPATGITPLP